MGIKRFTLMCLDGTVLSSSEILEAPKKGRKVVILGDTSDSSAIELIAQNADLLVHESTNAFIKEYEKDRNSTPQVRNLCYFLFSVL